jgi:type II secretory pathway pseudopilin PulG
MIEIAICLAIIGFALIAIILALPFGLNAQRDNRQETVVGQDAAALIEIIRSGAHGPDDLTNYVYLISNTVTAYGPNAVPGATHVYGYTFGAVTYDGALQGTLPGITNGARIIGLLSTPELIDASYHATNNLYSGGYSNHVVAYVRSMSGLAVEKPPQNNSIMVDGTFKYRLYIENAAVFMDTNLFNLGQLPPTYNPAYNQNLGTSLRELRLAFRWPVLPSGAVANQGASPLNFRASVAGQVQHVFTNNLDLYYYQPQTFSSTP